MIDTSIVIAWERGEFDPAEIRGRFEAELVFLSAITASELLHGVHRADTAVRRGKRRDFVERLLNTIPVLPIDLEVARTHARIWADLSSQGRLIGAHDLLIAATAMTHTLIVATRNQKDFERVTGLAVEMW